LAIPFLGLPAVGLWVLLTTAVILVTSRTSKVAGELVRSV
jgi:hypothetical protein